ncbi:MAG: oligosaccharide flippase family protein [Candidatus Omnitrophota bacterium]
MNKGKILKDIFKFTSARYMSQGIGFFTAIALRRFLGPFYMGAWSLLKVLLGYFHYLFLGVDYGASNKIPFYAGQENREAEEDVKNTALTVMLLAGVLTSVCLLISAIIFRQKLQIEIVVGFYVLSVFVIVNNFCSFYQIVLRAKHNFSVLSKSIVFESIVNLLLTILLVSNFKIYGLYVVLIIVTLINLAFMHFLARYRFKFSLNFNRAKELLKTGFPLMVVGILGWFLVSLDRIMIGIMLGVTFVGYYSIANMAQGYIVQLSGFGTVIYPRMMEAYGKKGDIDDIKKYVVIPPLIIAYFLPSVLGMVYFIVPLLVIKVLPDFEPGVTAVQILLLQMFFAASYTQASHFLVALGKQKMFIPITISAIIVNVVGNYIMIKNGFGIYGVAAVTSFVAFLNFVIFQTYAMKHFSGFRRISFFLCKVIFPLLYTATVVLLLNRNVHSQSYLLEIFFKISILLISSLPLYIYIEKKTNIISHFLNVHINHDQR